MNTERKFPQASSMTPDGAANYFLAEPGAGTVEVDRLTLTVRLSRVAERKVSQAPLKYAPMVAAALAKAEADIAAIKEAEKVSTLEQAMKDAALMCDRHVRLDVVDSYICDIKSTFDPDDRTVQIITGHGDHAQFWMSFKDLTAMKDLLVDLHAQVEKVNAAEV